MNYTQNEKIAQVKETTLVVGIDVGSEFHYARAFDWRGYEYSKKAFKFSNSEAGLTDFMTWMLTIKNEFKKLIKNGEVNGATSNPAIFKNAILTSPAYKSRLSELGNLSAKQKYETLAKEDIKAAGWP